MVGILLVAIIMASILIPSVATVLGRRIWWPGHQLDRSLPKGTVEPVDETIDAPVETGIPAEEPAV
jgi:RND superfamily putative drug exporter